jgi:hypothetical protein
MITKKEMQRRGLTALRIGVCNLCRAVMEEINAQIDKHCRMTELHHTAYDDSGPLKYTIELCH